MIKQCIKNALRNMGYDLIRYDPASHPYARRKKLLDVYGVNVVMDVGANAGQYAKSLRSIGYKGNIISFEPLSSAYDELKENADGDELWEAIHCAIGNGDGKIEINISGNSFSSSILKMLPAHEKSAPNSKYIGKEEVEIRKLDSVFGEVCRTDQSIYLKIDTQGFEKSVIEGAENVLSFIHTIQLEMSLTPLYEDELLFNEMYQLLYQKGYRMVAIEQGFADEKTGQLLQVDGIFHRF